MNVTGVDLNFKLSSGLQTIRLRYILCTPDYQTHLVSTYIRLRFTKEVLMSLSRILLVVVLALLAGCASQIMSSYIGKDIREVVLDYGPPANAMDMGDWRRAFQWIMNTSYTTPVYANTTGSATTTGYTTWMNSNTTISGGQTVSSNCMYTLFTNWDEASKSWRVVDFKKPNFMCE